MRNIAVIYAPDDPLEIRFGTELSKYIPTKCRAFILNKIPIIWNCSLIPELESEVFTVQFPYMLKELNALPEKLIRKACKKIYFTLKKLGVNEVVLESRLGRIKAVSSWFDSLQSIHNFDGKSIFSAYMLDILKNICSLMRICLDSVRIGVIIDNPDDKQVKIIKKVAQETRFLSILSMNPENLIPIIQSIYDETGLVIELSKDAKGILPECGILLNLSSDADIACVDMLPDYSVIINYGGGIQSKKYKGIIINDIYLYNNLVSSKSYSWITQTNFCEAVIAAKNTGFEETSQRAEAWPADSIKELGYKISGFIGINGRIPMTEFETLSRRHRQREVI